MLKKRKTPLSALFPEREALRNKPLVKPKTENNDPVIQNKNKR